MARVVVPARGRHALVVVEARYTKTVWHGESGSIWYIIDTLHDDEVVFSSFSPIAAAQMLRLLEGRG